MPTATKSRLYGRRYPWPEWFALGEFTLTRGRDFNGRVDTFVTQVRGAAVRHRKSIRITVGDDGWTVTVTVCGSLGPRRKCQASA